jgi:hypothetical protein
MDRNTCEFYVRFAIVIVSQNADIEGTITEIAIIISIAATEKRSLIVQTIVNLNWAGSISVQTLALASYSTIKERTIAENELVRTFLNFVNESQLTVACFLFPVPLRVAL